MGVERGYRQLPLNRRFLLPMLPKSQAELPERCMQVILMKLNYKT